MNCLLTCLLYLGVGCYGLANIILTYHKPTKFFGVIRQIDLEMLTAQKLEEVSELHIEYIHC